MWALDQATVGDGVVVVVVVKHDQLDGGGQAGHRKVRAVRVFEREGGYTSGHLMIVNVAPGVRIAVHHDQDLQNLPM